jgi:hypothetical protein
MEEEGIDGIKPFSNGWFDVHTDVLSNQLYR